MLVVAIEARNTAHMAEPPTAPRFHVSYDNPTLVDTYALQVSPRKGRTWNTHAFASTWSDFSAGFIHRMHIAVKERRYRFDACDTSELEQP